jgi:hypothetical protein
MVKPRKSGWQRKQSQAPRQFEDLCDNSTRCLPFARRLVHFSQPGTSTLRLSATLLDLPDLDLDRLPVFCSILFPKE